MTTRPVNISDVANLRPWLFVARKRRAALCLAALFAIALLSSCGGDSSGPEPSIDGTWTGVAQGGTFTLTLTETNNTVTGTGSVTGGSGSAALTVTGTFDNPAFSLTLASPGFQSINYAGEMEGDALDGLMNGSGFVNEPLSMTR